MSMYKLFSHNVEIHYKSSFLSKAMLFTFITTLLNVVLPFILAYRSRGFWLKTHHFYEQPTVHFTYEYLLVAETDDPSQPILCGDAYPLNNDALLEESCAMFQIQEYDHDKDGRNDVLDFKFRLNIPPERTIVSILLLIELDFQLKSICPLHMQSLAVISKEFSIPPSGLKYYGDLQFYQISHLPCMKNFIDTKYNTSLFDYIQDANSNIVDYILEHYYNREVTTEIKTIHSRTQYGHTSSMQLNARLRVPEVPVLYIPSILQELKWAWPQYLSLVVIFYWIFNRIKRFVFNNRLLMAWEVMPFKKNVY